MLSGREDVINLGYHVWVAVLYRPTLALFSGPLNSGLGVVRNTNRHVYDLVQNYVEGVLSV